jgi:hypothetical protein
MASMDLRSRLANIAFFEGLAAWTCLTASIHFDSSYISPYQTKVFDMPGQWCLREWIGGLNPPSTDYFGVRLADITRIIASPEGPIFSVPTTTGSPSRMLMSVLSPVLS